MATERTVRREVTEQTVEPGETTLAPDRVGKERVTETTTQEVPVAVPVVPAKPAATNVNVNQDPASGNLNINTPDGTQVNINT